MVLSLDIYGTKFRYFPPLGEDIKEKGRGETKMNYRPEGWGTTKDGLIGLGAEDQEAKDRHFEAGADAMLEGLKAQNSYMVNCSNKILPANLVIGKGHLVYIPEE